MRLRILSLLAALCGFAAMSVHAAPISPCGFAETMDLAGATCSAGNVILNVGIWNGGVFNDVKDKGPIVSQGDFDVFFEPAGNGFRLDLNWAISSFGHVSDGDDGTQVNEVYNFYYNLTAAPGFVITGTHLETDITPVLDNNLNEATYPANAQTAVIVHQQTPTAQSATASIDATIHGPVGDCLNQSCTPFVHENTDQYDPTGALIGNFNDSGYGDLLVSEFAQDGGATRGSYIQVTYDIAPAGQVTAVPEPESLALILTGLGLLGLGFGSRGLVFGLLLRPAPRFR
jgi:hypothetical protein